MTLAPFVFLDWQACTAQCGWDRYRLCRHVLLPVRDAAERGAANCRMYENEEAPIRGLVICCAFRDERREDG
jgi:hypothetical protein